MKQPTKLMKRALSRLNEWAEGCMEKTEREGLVWINLTGNVKVAPLPGPSPRVRILPKGVTIGESVSWHIGADKDGNAVAIYDEDEETVRRFYEKWNRA